MFTLDIVLKIIITSMLGYLTINSFLRFHFSIERTDFVFIAIFFVITICYLGTDKIFEYGLTTGILLVLYLVARFVIRKRKMMGYVLLNVYRNDFAAVRTFILEAAEEMDIELNRICHKRNKPFLLVLKKVDPEDCQKLLKKVDEHFTHQKKRFTMYNYWFIIVYLVLMVALWRF
ncbi:MAG TPA: hypothetical protein PK113_03680 [Bacillota bacterium]|nr:hypothetical protein [Bacillota bacterium]